MLSFLILFSLATRPPPPPPPPPYYPPISFSAGFSDDAVFQRSVSEGHKVYGFTTTNEAIIVQATISADDTYSVEATITPWVSTSGCTATSCIDPKTRLPPPHGSFTWSATLNPVEAAGGEYTISASKGKGANETVTLERVTYGDVYFCSGQSNMALETFFTFSSDTLKQEIASGKYNELRHFMYVGKHVCVRACVRACLRLVFCRCGGDCACACLIVISPHTHIHTLSHTPTIAQ